MQNVWIDTLNTLIYRINSFSAGYRQNIAIIGDPYIGKTSLIKRVLDSADLKRDTVIPIYLEVKIEPFEFCAKRFIKSALFQLLQSTSALVTPYDTVLLIEDLNRAYPKTTQICQRVLQDLEKNRFEEAYSFMLDIPATMYEETKRRCILILDEFHNLANFPIKNPFGILAKKIMIQKDTMFLLISSRSTLSQRILAEKLTMLFGNFEKIILPAFDINSSRNFIQENIRGANLPQAHIDFISSFVGSRPFYMKLICDEIERLVSSKKVPLDDHAGLIVNAFTETVFKKTGIINQYFFNLLFKISDGRLLSKITSVLIAISSENKKQLDIVRSARLQSKEVSRILARLLEMDILTRNGSFYRFKDNLFSFWLKAVYLKRIMSFSIDESLEEIHFKKELSNKLAAYLQEFEKELILRIVDLFKLFRNDIVQLNGKRHKLFSFNEVRKTEEDFCNSANIMALSERVRWMCTVKREFVTENDMTDIVKNLKKKRRNSKIHRNILISLGGIDENAYLMAKEAKFWVWDQESLNVLMELYGKPYIG